MKVIKFHILFCLLFFSVTVTAQVTTEETDSLIIKKFATGISNTDAANPKYVLIKLDKQGVNFVKKNFRTAIKRQINDQWLIVEAGALTKIKQTISLKEVLPVNNNWKLSPALLQIQNKLNAAVYNFHIEVSDPAAFGKLIRENAAVARISGKPSRELYVVRAPFSIVKKLLNEGFVLSVDLRLTSPKEETVINDYDNSTNAINLLAAKYPVIDGANLTGSIKEKLFDTTDIDFKNRYRLTGLGSSETTTHATIMTTLIAGAGNSFFTGKGVAPAATITSSDFANLLPDGNSYQQYNISMQNHSYGVGIENFYGSDAAAYDESMITNPALLHVFSAGNMGNTTDTSDGSQYENINGFANITGSFKMAKNSLTAGSVDSFFTVPDLSSKGPAYDGRIKPELVAYGNDGSSGAAAITSGTILAVQSAYAKNHGGLLPANALTKAILINSADDINKPGPDFYSGYGNVNAYKAVKDMLSAHYFTGLVNDGETRNFPVKLPTNAKNLKITLVWTDPPAQTNAFTSLVNDLDLQLQKQTSEWLPWVLNSFPDKDSLNQPAKRKRDSLNVVEQVTITDPKAGDYIIHVKGYDIPEGPQEFYIAYRWDAADSFYFVSPAAQDHFTSGDKSIFRWQSTYANNTNGKLEYSIDKGATWQLVNNTVNLDNKYLTWTTPDTFSIALARMTIGSDVYISDTFNFSHPLSPQVGFNCDDSVLIFWNKIPGADKYQVYTLGDKYLQPLAITLDTSITISKNVSPYIAVSTVLENNYTGVKSYTFNYNYQGVECYISNFLADLTTNKTALLQLSLGTVYNISSIQFQRLTASGWQTINTISPVNDLENSYEDNNLQAGINTYRAMITLFNGTTIISETVVVNFAGNKHFFLLPNPVPQGHNLTILSDNFQNNTVIIYDVMGHKILQQQFNSTVSEIAVSHFARGIYFVAIYFESKRLFSSKIVVQ